MRYLRRTNPCHPFVNPDEVNAVPESEDFAKAFQLKRSGNGINIDKMINRQTIAEATAAGFGVRPDLAGVGQTHIDSL